MLLEEEKKTIVEKIVLFLTFVLNLWAEMFSAHRRNEELLWIKQQNSFS